MDIEEALELSKIWRLNGSEGWRVVCGVLADEVIELRELINHLCIVVPADEQQLNNIHELTKNVSLDDEE